MIELKDCEGRYFRLLASRAEDSMNFAKRKAIRNALETYKKEGIGHIQELYVNTSRRLSAFTPVVFMYRGLLILGCHSFSRKNSKIIIRWANTK